MVSYETSDFGLEERLFASWKESDTKQ